MNNEIRIELLDVNNYPRVCKLSISEEKKHISIVTNAYWIGISRYEEHTELYVTKKGDEDAISG